MYSDSKTQQTKNQKWTYFDEPFALQSFAYDTLNEVIINFSKAIPKQKQVRKAKLLLFLRTGNEANKTFWTRTRVEDLGDQIVHWTYGHRYPQHAISYNSETIQIPCCKTRQIRVKSNHVQLKNCHQMQYFITGYLQ